MSLYKRIACIARKELSSWKSCQLITTNLICSYNTVFQDVLTKHYSVTAEFNGYKAFKLAQELIKWQPDLIIWLDHHPNAALLIPELCSVYHDYLFSSRPKFIVHLYGDFVLDCQGWKKSELSLSQWPLRFITASDKQKKLIESFFCSKDSIVSTIPFPVDKQVFYYDRFKEESSALRNLLNVKQEDKVIIYTGRISYQKNVDMLIKILNSIDPLFNKQLHLWIVGPWDDILIPYFGKHGACGSFYNHFSNSIKNFSNININFLGNHTSENLCKLYNAADLFVSFSTHNDEDYGMAPAEALCCGLPCILSNWAGYSNFIKYSKNITLVPVNDTPPRPSVLIEEARLSLLKTLFKIPLSTDERNEISQDAGSFISTKGVAKEIEFLLLNMTFGVVENFSPIFIRLCSKFINNPKAPFDEQLYREIYGNYGL